MLHCNSGAITPTGAIKEDDKITLLPTDANKVVTQSACTDQQVEPTATASVPQLNPALGAPRISINPDFPKDGQIQDLSLGLFAKSQSPPKDSLNKRWGIASWMSSVVLPCHIVDGFIMFTSVYSAWKKPKAHFDGSLSLTNQTKKEAPHWLVLLLLLLLSESTVVISILSECFMNSPQYIFYTAESQ